MSNKNNFRTVNSLFSKIREDFSSYDNSGLIDEGRFYTDIKYILNILGNLWYINEQEFIEIDNYKGKLPSNFSNLDFAYKCDSSPELENGVVLTMQTFDHFPLMEVMDWHAKPSSSCGKNNCNNSCCKPPSNCIFNAYEKIMVTSPEGIVRNYSNPELLRLGNVNTKREFCAKNCANVFSNSQHTITIQNNHIYTNFKSGSIYLSYNGFPIDEETGLPLIPNNSTIEKCIENYIKYNLVKVLATNKNADLINLISLYKQDYRESLQDAMYETKLPTFNSMVNDIRKTRLRFSFYY